MTEAMIICAVILLLATASSKFFYKLGVPALLLFLVLGMLFGSDGIVGIAFDNYDLASQISSVGLLFIMFYGGFGTNWKAARPVATKAIVLSTLGVVITALITGLFCMFILKTTLLEGLLIGSVLGSTDAASVFSILRSRKLNLKGGLASLLEIESGSNDPIAYLMTIVILSLMGSHTGPSPVITVLQQVVFGVGIGLLLAVAAGWVLRNVNLEIDGLYPIFITAVVVLAYGLCLWSGGNGFLSVYILGIILGNGKFLHKRSLVHFFDTVSWLMQIMLFFTLGLLSFPTRLPAVLFSGVAISLFMVIFARPLATFLILTPFKTSFRQQLLVSWVGLRGAASIVFAIFAVTYGELMENDIFHIVFFVALFSVGVQGSLIPWVARKLNLVEAEDTVFKTFNDYQEEASTKLLEVNVDENNPWKGRSIMDADIPDDILVVMIKRGDEVILPKGSTQIFNGDTLVLSGAVEKIPDLIPGH